MNDLMRPSMYGAYHPIQPVLQAGPDAPLTAVDVVGPVCETGDTFARARMLPPLEAEDLVVFGAAGLIVRACHRHIMHVARGGDSGAG